MKIREYLTEQSIIAYREQVIEECAKVVENHPGFGLNLEQIAAAIRALKDKP